MRALLHMKDLWNKECTRLRLAQEEVKLLVDGPAGCELAELAVEKETMERYLQTKHENSAAISLLQKEALRWAEVNNHQLKLLCNASTPQLSKEKEEEYRS